MNNPHTILELIADIMPEGPQERAIKSVLADVLRLQVVAEKARRLALGALDKQKYVTNIQDAQDIIDLTNHLSIKEHISCK